MQKGTLYEELDIGVEPPCIKQGAGIMYFRIFFVLNRVRVSNPQQVTYTQILFKYPLPPGSTPYFFSNFSWRWPTRATKYKTLTNISGSTVIVPKGCSCLLARRLKFIIIIIIISFITVFAGVLFVHQPGTNHAPRASVTQVNHYYCYYYY